MFSLYRPAIKEAKPEDVTHSLAFALMFDGKKRYRQADEMMARIVANHLMEHLHRSGFVIMKRPPGPGHSTAAPKASK